MGAADSYFTRTTVRMDDANRMVPEIPTRDAGVRVITMSLDDTRGPTRALPLQRAPDRTLPGRCHPMDDNRRKRSGSTAAPAANPTR